jgi:hypothetical protein
LLLQHDDQIRSKKKYVVCKGASVVTYAEKMLGLGKAHDLLLEFLDEKDHRRHVHGTKVITKWMILHVFKSKPAKCFAWGQILNSLYNVESVFEDLFNLHGCNLRFLWYVSFKMLGSETEHQRLLFCHGRLVMMCMLLEALEAVWASHVSACVDTRPEVLATLERVSTVMAR